MRRRYPTNAEMGRNNRNTPDFIGLFGRNKRTAKWCLLRPVSPGFPGVLRLLRPESARDRFQGRQAALSRNGSPRQACASRAHRSGTVMLAHREALWRKQWA
jgi:hypothetical protein